MKQPVPDTAPPSSTRPESAKPESAALDSKVPDPAPFVSVVMANHRGAPFLEAAMRSVLGQTHRRLELILSDDASGDASTAIARQVAADDRRVRLIEARINGGPSRARNAALDLARGEWIAVVDSDDLLHPDRIARMLAAATRLGSDAVADDLAPFGDAPPPDLSGDPPPDALPDAPGDGATMFGALLGDGPVALTALDLLREARLGYLKLLIRRSALADLRYDETLRNGEDFDLYLRLLLQGAHMVMLPGAGYHYRRHAASLSHRLSEAVLTALIAAHDRLAGQSGTQAPGIAAAMVRRRAALKRARRYTRLVAALKGGRAGQAAMLLVRHPTLVSDLAHSLRDRRRRQRLNRPPASATGNRPP